MAYCDIERHDDVVVVWLDEPRSTVNTLSMGMLDEFEAMIDDIEKNNDIKGAVLISRKKDVFIAGADVKALLEMESGEQATELSRRGNALLCRMADLKKPIIAAIHGACLGGGNEVAMACHYRIATDHPKTIFGQPEVKLGLLPGGGGTQRLPRLVGLTKALDILLTGKNVYPYPAKKMGLIDEIIHPPGLLQAAIAVARDGVPERKAKRSTMDKVLESTSFTRDYVTKKALETVERKTRGNYPAPKKILECVSIGLDEGLKKGLEAESKGFGELQETPECKQLIGLFLATQAAKHNPFEKNAKDVSTLAMLGAGFMGAGITEVSITKGIEVTLRDLNMEGVGRAKQTIWKNLQSKVKKRALSSFQADVIMSRIEGVTDLEQIKGADIVVEAVFEDIDLKKRIVAEVESVGGRGTIFASNTSSLPIGDIAADAKYPQNIIGMHYFSPVPKMPLLEIIVTEKTTQAVKGTAIKLGQRQGKVVIVVNDGPGFYTTRVLTALTNEAIQMLAEGARIEDIDNAMKDFGFPVGPITLMDEVGIDVGAHIARGALADMFRARGIEDNTVIQDIAKAGLHGRKTGKGFYTYGKGKSKSINTDMYKYFGGDDRKDFDKQTIQERVALIFVNEAVRCLEENILTTALDGDLGAVMGLGFPPFRGGPFRYIDSEGAQTIVDKLKALEDVHGVRFKASELLVSKAKAGETFYD